jgi:hypothetical protein
MNTAKTKTANAKPKTKPRRSQGGPSAVSAEKAQKPASKVPSDPIAVGQKVTHNLPAKPESGAPGDANGTTFSQLSEMTYKKVQDVPLKEIYENDGAIVEEAETNADEGEHFSSMTPKDVFGNPKWINRTATEPYDTRPPERVRIMNFPEGAIKPYADHMKGYRHVDGKIVLTFSWNQDPMQYGEVWFAFIPGGRSNYAAAHHHSPSQFSMFPHVKVDLSSTGTASLTITRPAGIPLFDLVEGTNSWGYLAMHHFTGAMGKRNGAYSRVWIEIHAHWESITLNNPCPVPHATLSHAPVVAQHGFILDNGKRVPYAFSRKMKDQYDTQDRMTTESENVYLRQYRNEGSGVMSNSCILLAPSATVDPPVFGEAYEGRCVLRYGDRQYLPEDTEFPGLVAKIFSDSNQFDLNATVEHHADYVVAGTYALNTMMDAYESVNRVRQAYNEPAPGSTTTGGSVTSGTTVSVQSRSTEQDTQLTNYQGVDLDFYGDKVRKAAPENKLDDLFGHEMLSFMRDCDLDVDVHKAYQQPFFSASCIQKLVFPSNAYKNADHIIDNSISSGTPGLPVKVRALSPWAAYSSQFAESKARVHLRLRVTKSKFHTMTIRIAYYPTGNAPNADDKDDFDLSRADIKEYHLADSNEIEWDQPPAANFNGYDSNFAILIDLYNATTNMSVNSKVMVAGYVRYSECKVSGFRGMRQVPYYSATDYNVVPTNNVSDLAVAVGDKVSTLCSHYWYNKINTWLSVSPSRIATAITNYENFDKEKFTNLRNAYKASTNHYALAQQLFDNTQTYDAAAIGEFLLKWHLLINILRNVSFKHAGAIQKHFAGQFHNLLAHCTVNEPDIVNYLERLIPKRTTTYHLGVPSATVEKTCAALTRFGYTNVNYTGEARGVQLIPSRLHSIWFNLEGSNHVTQSWIDFYAPYFFANTGSWHVRYKPMNTFNSKNPTGIGTITRVNEYSFPFDQNVLMERHATTGDSVVVDGTPLYLHVPAHSKRPLIHSMPLDAFSTNDWSHMGGTNISPVPAAQFTFAVDEEVPGEIHLKPGKDFRFHQYQGFVDFAANDRFYMMVHSNGSSSDLVWPHFTWSLYSNNNKFAP